jgi:hypothetical protein
MQHNLQPDRSLIILGMHRSGTSCLTGSLQAGGLSLGEHSTWNPHNRKGNRENDRIVMLHESILASNNCSWHQPSKNMQWNQQQLQNATRILQDNANCEIWGFKDPRTLFTINGWLSLGIKPAYIGIFRSPRLVAKSLLKRGGEIDSYRQGLDVWYAYNRQLLRQYKKQPFPLLCFDWDEDTFHQALNKLHHTLGLKPLSSDERFFEQGLVHQRGRDVEISLPWRVKRLYNQLLKISLKYQ